MKNEAQCYGLEACVKGNHKENKLTVKFTEWLQNIEQV